MKLPSRSIERKAAAEPTLAEEMKARAGILGGSAALLWLVHLVDTIVGHRLAWFGVHPRSLQGLWGILFAPFLHGSWSHLLANTVPLVMLGAIVMLWRKRDFFLVGAIAALVSGLGTWLVGGANTVHLGASGVIFGLLGYLLSRGIFERKTWSIVVGVVTFFVYGGALHGLLPGATGVSWEGHLFGFLGGVLAARLAATRAPAAEDAEERPRARQRIGVTSPQRRIAEDAGEASIDEDLEALRRKMGG
jgi:membrane associated rhomboid family serine protease